jgi:hypothetical protein
MLDIDKIEIALKSLNETLEHDKAPNTELVVCGGAALNVMGLVKRTTRDIDVIGILEMNGEIVRLAMLREFPIYLLQAIKDVKNTLGLPEDWINLGPEKTLDYAFLPTGIETRLKRIVYGEKLTIFYLSRIDQIYFKLLAASAMEVSHHLDDLKVLNPTVGELGEAVKWVLTQSITDEKKMNLKTILEQLSYV